MTPDTLTFADARSARLASTWSGAVELVGRSHAISRVQELLRRAAGSDACTLITGEPGSAVESVARELHGRSRRADAAFVGWIEQEWRWLEQEKHEDQDADEED